MNIQKFELDFESALNHFKSVFYDVNGLHDKIFEYTNFSNGNFYTYLPKSIDIQKLYYFNSDILSNLNCGDMPAELQDFLFNLFSFHLYNNKKSIIVFEETLFKKEDMAGALFNISREVFNLAGVANNEDLYYLFKEFDLINQVSDYILCQSPFIATFSKVDDLKINQKVLNSSSLVEIRKNAQFIVVGSYCGLGYVIWERNI